MKQIVLFLCCLLGLPLAARAAEADFFIKVMSDRSTVYAGDSMLVSVVLYSVSPLQKVTTKDDFEVKGKCRVRRLDINREATVGRVRDGRRIYYTMVWAQYVVAPAVAGDCKVAPMKFKALMQEAEYIPDWIEQMMGARPKFRERKVEGSSEEFRFTVKEKPLRSTQEMMESGNVI